jgi:hypothetical protein
MAALLPQVTLRGAFQWNNAAFLPLSLLANFGVTLAQWQMVFAIIESGRRQRRRDFSVIAHQDFPQSYQAQNGVESEGLIECQQRRYDANETKRRCQHDHAHCG